MVVVAHGRAGRQDPMRGVGGDGRVTSGDMKTGVSKELPLSEQEKNPNRG